MALGTALLGALRTAQIAGLTSAQIGALSTAQVALLFANSTAALTSRQIAGLTSTQVASLTSAQLNALGTKQIIGIETADLRAIATATVQALSTANIAALSAAQVSALTLGQLSALVTDQLRALESADLAAISTANVTALGTAMLGALRTTQIAGLTTAQISALSTAQVATLFANGAAALTSRQIAGLSSSQFASLTSAQLNALGTKHIISIETADLAVIGTDTLNALSTTNFAALKIAQIASLTSNQVKNLSTANIAALCSSQIVALNVVGVAGFSETQKTARADRILVTPLMLDLDGNGVKTLSLAQGVHFDLRGDGTANPVGWVSATDGLLVMDRNGDGSINDGTELFGSAVRLADGTAAKDGFEALRLLDTNGDDVIDANDARFDQLAVWRDANSDGVTQAGELTSLSELAITSLGLTPVVHAGIDNGNLIGLVSSYTSRDGQTHEFSDVWLANQEPVAADEAANLAGVLDAYSLAMSAAASSAQPVSPVLADQGLSTDVSMLAGALAQFDVNGAAGIRTPTGGLDTGIASQASARLLGDGLPKGFIAGSFDSASKA